MAAAAEMIMRSKSPVRLYLIRTPGSDVPWPTTSIPVGRSKWCIVGMYTPTITLAELREDLTVAEREMRVAA